MNKLTGQKTVAEIEADTRRTEAVTAEAERLREQLLSLDAKLDRVIELVGAGADPGVARPASKRRKPSGAGKE